MNPFRLMTAGESGLNSFFAALLRGRKCRRSVSCAVLCALLLVISLSACGGAATSMYLRRMEGTVSVSDGDGKDVKPKEDLGLYSGYRVGTQTASFAWIDLDSVKLTKLNENSEAEIVNEGKNLTIDVLSGELYFNVTEPLKEDETLEIRTSSMVTAIRGTQGWVTQDTVALLEGSVTVTAGEQEITVNAGEMAVLSDTGELSVQPYKREDIPGFVADEPIGDVSAENSAADQESENVASETSDDGTMDVSEAEEVNSESTTVETPVTVEEEITEDTEQTEASQEEIHDRWTGTYGSLEGTNYSMKVTSGGNNIYQIAFSDEDGNLIREVTASYQEDTGLAADDGSLSIIIAGREQVVVEGETDVQGFYLHVDD